MITNFDKATCKKISAEIVEALAAVAERNGLELVNRGGVFEELLFKPKFELKCKCAADGKPREQAEFEKLAPLFGLKPSDYRREFTSNGRVFKLVGCKPGGAKFVFVGEGLNGGRFKFTSDIATQFRTTPVQLEERPAPGLLLVRSR